MISIASFQRSEAEEPPDHEANRRSDQERDDRGPVPSWPLDDRVAEPRTASLPDRDAADVVASAVMVASRVTAPRNNGDRYPDQELGRVHAGNAIKGTATRYVPISDGP